MGVENREACDGDVPVALHCRACGEEFWTDETLLNDCPYCGAREWEVADTDEGA